MSTLIYVGKTACIVASVLAIKNAHRYEVTEDEVLEAARYAWENKFGSLVLQAGERSGKDYVRRIERLVKEIKEMSHGELGITLSLGEQTEETYRRWFEAGAHRYLLRIEVSNPELYHRYHPQNKIHDYEARLQALHLLRKVGYQVGSGVMIGLPFQTAEDLADDLLFLQEHDIDMVGMGPYIEHEDTPMYEYRDQLMPKMDRFYLSLKMVAILRIMMKDINIAATTAMQAIDPMGREKSLKVGANIIMPNLTPSRYREDYLLYEDKPCTDEDAEECKRCLEAGYTWQAVRSDTANGVTQNTLPGAGNHEILGIFAKCGQCFKECWPAD